MFLAIELQYQFALQLKGDLQPIKQKIKEDNQTKSEREVKEKTLLYIYFFYNRLDKIVEMVLVRYNFFWQPIHCFICKHFNYLYHLLHIFKANLTNRYMQKQNIYNRILQQQQQKNENKLIFDKYIFPDLQLLIVHF